MSTDLIGSGELARCIEASAAPEWAAETDDPLIARLVQFDPSAKRREFVEQGAFMQQPRFLPAETAEQLADAARSVESSVNRNYLPGHKQGGSVSRHTIDRLAPCIARLYRSRTLKAWLERVAGEPLLECPAADAHAYALYFYTRPGDHIGWHYDTSYYVGRRYTLLLGVLDESSCRLEYQLHTREPGAALQAGSLQMGPGGMVFFDGDRLRHRITPLGAGQRRISLTFEYVTDPAMRPWRRVISTVKDAVAYFGFRQLFARSGKGSTGRA